MQEKDQVFGGIATQVSGAKQHVAGFPNFLRARPRVRQPLNKTQNPLLGAFGGAEQERINQLLVGFTFPEQGAHGATGGAMVFPRVAVGSTHERPGNVGGKRGAVNVVATDNALGGEGSGEGGAFLLGGAGDDGVVFLRVGWFCRHEGFEGGAALFESALTCIVLTGVVLARVMRLGGISHRYLLSGRS